MTRSHVFGYGSLVNAATHGFSPVEPATLAGWRRVWVPSVLRPMAFLSVEPADAEIEGLFARVKATEWPALDEREAAYDTHSVTARRHAGGDAPTLVYAVPERNAAPVGTRHPVLLSYIDAVVQGYLQVFGEAGAAAFFATTAGWEIPVLNDRAAPRYPRHQSLSAAERDCVDTLLAQTSATVVEEAHKPGL